MAVQRNPPSFLAIGQLVVSAGQAGQPGVVCHAFRSPGFTYPGILPDEVTQAGSAVGRPPHMGVLAKDTCGLLWVR